MPVTAKISWVDGALLVAEAGSGHTVTLDGAADIGGRNLAARPMEMVLMGMGGCTAMDVASMLKKQRQDIEGIEISLVAERADDHPKVFTSVKVVYTVRGRHLNKALIERAVRLSDEKYCSATAMIRKSASVSCEVVLVEGLSPWFRTMNAGLTGARPPVCSALLRRTWVRASSPLSRPDAVSDQGLSGQQ